MEHAIILLKPQTISSTLVQYLHSLFDANKLTIVLTKKIRLSRTQVEESFTTLCDKNKYIDYMTSDYVYVYLVRGDFAISKVKQIKYMLRKMFGVSRFNLYNLLHTTDEGLEYYMQFKCFFPTFDIREYCGFADAAVYEEYGTYTPQFSFTLLNSCAKNMHIEFYGVNRQFIYNGNLINLVSYTSGANLFIADDMKMFINQINKCGGFVCLGVMPIKYYTDSLFKELSDMGVKAAFVFDKAFTLEQSKNLQDYLEKYDIIPLGGSNRKVPPFEITISESTYVRLKERISFYAN